MYAYLSVCHVVVHYVGGSLLSECGNELFNGVRGQPQQLPHYVCISDDCHVIRGVKS